MVPSRQRLAKALVADGMEPRRSGQPRPGQKPSGALQGLGLDVETVHHPARSRAPGQKQRVVAVARRGVHGHVARAQDPGQAGLGEGQGGGGQHETPPGGGAGTAQAPQQRLYFLPLPQGQGSLRPAAGRDAGRVPAVSCAAPPGSPST